MMPKVVKNLPKEASRLRSFRKHTGLKQEEFASILELKQGSYSDIERGKIYLNTKHIKTLMNRFQFNPIWFLTGKGQMELSNDKTLNEKKVFKIDDGALENSLKDLKAEKQNLLLQVHSLERENKTLQKLVTLLERQIEG